MSYETSEQLKNNRKQPYNNDTNANGYKFLSQASSTLLEIFALQNNVYLGLFCSNRLRYIFQTSNLKNASLDKESRIDHREAYMGLVNNKKILSQIINLEIEINNQLNAKEKLNIRTFICGGSSFNKGQKATKFLLQRIPFLFDNENDITTYLDSIRNVTHLITEDGYWLRVKAGEKTFSWSSKQMKLLHHDIISPREAEVIKLWMKGLSCSKIATQLFISINTVKNHLKACRNRLLARDNASLVQLCLLNDVIRSSFV